VYLLRTDRGVCALTEFCHMTTMMSRTVARQQYRPIINAMTGHAPNYRSTARRYICVWSY